MVVISNWVGEYVFLRNDFPVDVTDRKGNTYQSVEHAFQAAKIDYSADPDLDSEEEVKFLQSINTANSAREAKRIGGGLEIDVEAWDADKVDIMEDLLRRKFDQRPDLARLLLLTEGNSIVMKYRDTFWGDGGDGSGENHQGRLLEKIRGEMLAKAKAKLDDSWINPDGTVKWDGSQKPKPAPEPPPYASVGLRPHIAGKSAGKPDVVVQSPTPQGQKPIPLPPSSLSSKKLPKTDRSGMSTASAVADSDVNTSQGYQDALGQICGDIDDL